MTQHPLFAWLYEEQNDSTTAAETITLILWELNAKMHLLLSFNSDSGIAWEGVSKTCAQVNQSFGTFGLRFLVASFLVKSEFKRRFDKSLADMFFMMLIRSGWVSHLGQIRLNRVSNFCFRIGWSNYFMTVWMKQATSTFDDLSLPPMWAHD